MPKKENIFNIPNLLSFARILLSLILVYLVFAGFGIWTIVIVFSIAAITDALDGYIARKFNLKTEFGRKLDMFADRILMLSIIIAILSYMKLNGLLSRDVLIQTILIISREIIALPFLIIAWLIWGNIFPQARFIAKFATVMQGISFPMILLGWKISWIFSGITCVMGIASGCLYAYDSVFQKISSSKKNIHKK
jgi:cardiolipin synthase